MLSIIFKQFSEFTHRGAKKIYAAAPPAVRQVAEVISAIEGPYLRGRVKFNGRYFYAFCQDCVVISEGEYVEVIEEKGTFLIVKPLK